jgi:hypothetical protein
VKGGEHHFDAGDAILGVDVDWNAAAVVADGDRTINVNRDIDLVTVAGEMLVHGVIEHLGNTVMERALVRTSDIHAGLFPDGFETLELAELGGVVVAFDGLILGWRNRVSSVGHADLKKWKILEVKSHREIPPPTTEISLNWRIKVDVFAVF